MDGVQRFDPQVLRCIYCDNRNATKGNSYMPMCCGNQIICSKCFNGREKEIQCERCGRWVVPARIAGDFFRNIYQEVEGLSSKDGARDSNQEDRRRDEREFLGAMYEESNIMNEEGRKLYDEIHGMLREKNHDRRCRLYHNVQYICESVAMMRRKGHNGLITIHDALAFLCNGCGHGPMDKILEQGEVKAIKPHSWGDCLKECCGQLLDRRYLQYEGGRCSCGLMIMSRLGITPANEAQHEWRRALAKGQFPPDSKVSI